MTLGVNISTSLVINIKVKGKVVLVLNQTPRHEDDGEVEV